MIYRFERIVHDRFLHVWQKQKVSSFKFIKLDSEVNLYFLVNVSVMTDKNEFQSVKNILHVNNTDKVLVNVSVMTDKNEFQSVKNMLHVNSTDKVNQITDFLLNFLVTVTLLKHIYFAIRRGSI
jgi:hypothetical protein